MKINALLTERAVIQEQILADSTYREFHALGKMLMVEYAMDQKQIQKLFYNVAQGAEQQLNIDKDGDELASNRTLLGKGADVAGKVADAYRGLKDAIGKTGPVKGLDAIIDSVQRQVMQKAGGESGKVGQALEFYRELSKVPGMAMAVKIAVLGLAGLAGAGLGPVGIAAGLTFANKMLQGNKFSSAVMGAMETGGTVAAIQTAKDLLTTTRVGADYGDADDQSFGTIDRTTPDPLAGVDPNNIYRPDNIELPAADAAANTQPDLQAAQEWLDADEAGKAAIEQTTGMPGAQLQDIAVSNDLKPTTLSPGEELVTPGATDAGGSLAGQFAGGQYEVVKGDNLGSIAQSIGVKPDDIKGLNPQIDWSKPIQPGMELNMPPQGDGTGNIWDGYKTGSTYGDKMPMSQAQADTLSDRAGNLNRAQDLANPAQPVMPGTPSDGSYRQSAPLGRDGKPMPQMAGKINTGNMLREYIDIDTTARMWVLRESIGKPRGGVYLSEAGVRAIFQEVARRSVVNEGPALDKLRAWNQKTNANISKVTTPIKQTLRRGAESATNKITFRDLMVNWKRSAKLDKETSVDSEKVIDFLHGQGVKDLLIQAAFNKVGLTADPQQVGTPGVAGAAGGAGAGFLQGLGGAFAQTADALNKYNATKGGKARGRTQFNVGKMATAAPANATTAAEPTTAASTQAATTAQAPSSTTATSKLPTATSATAGQASKVTYDPKMFAKKASAPNFNALSTAASNGYKTSQSTATPAASDDTTAPAAANPFGQMANQLRTYAPPETTSTGGTLTQTPTGQVHKAKVAQPQQGTTVDLDQLKAKRATDTPASTGYGNRGIAGMDATAAKTPPAEKEVPGFLQSKLKGQTTGWTGRQKSTAPAMAESRVDFAAMLFNRMKKQS